jgi:hypothetical protein
VLGLQASTTPDLYTHTVCVCTYAYMCVCIHTYIFRQISISVLKQTLEQLRKVLFPGKDNFSDKHNSKTKSKHSSLQHQQERKHEEGMLGCGVWRCLLSCRWGAPPTWEEKGQEPLD